MSARAILALAAKDLKLFFGDRRALVFLSLTPILIARFLRLSFFGETTPRSA